MTERLVVELAADGRVRAHTEGIAGPACLDAVPLLEDLLEAVAVDSRYTHEFFTATSGQAPLEISEEDYA